jgi:hypothetical protein
VRPPGSAASTREGGRLALLALQESLSVGIPIINQTPPPPSAGVVLLLGGEFNQPSFSDTAPACFSSGVALECGLVLLMYVLLACLSDFGCGAGW